MDEELVRRVLRFGEIEVVVDILGDGEVVPECNDETTLADLENIWEKQGDREDSGLRLWNTALVLSRFLCLGPVQRLVRGTAVIEVACGLGIPGLVLSRVCPFVTLSDHHLRVIRLLEHNVALNPSAAKVLCSQLDWNAPVPDEMRGRFQTLLVSDALYEPAHTPALANCLCTLADPSGSTILVITPPEREGVNGFAEAILETTGVHTATVYTLKLPHDLVVGENAGGEIDEMFSVQYYVIVVQFGSHSGSSLRQAVAGIEVFEGIPTQLLGMGGNLDVADDMFDDINFE
eukprot:c274_g1_i1.p1 GENE.c274_g1_i1~~c274_g1_i1.p1  ORF type:complete len:302 (+),score=57.91 c274_g1_i1:38-907(+)